jgi:hypothetical protein
VIETPKEVSASSSGQDPEALAWSDGDSIPPLTPVLACKEHSNGRVVIINDNNFFDDNEINNADNKQLTLNIFEWLSISGKRILWYQKNVYTQYTITENYLPIANELRGRGYSVTSFNDTIDAAALGNSDILVILTTGNWDNYIYKSEIDFIEDFVKDGNALLLGGENSNCPTEYLNPIGSRFGVTFNKDKLVDPTNNNGNIKDPVIHLFASHIITSGISSFIPEVCCTLGGAGFGTTEPPIADAGPDQILKEGDVVQFNGSSSYDPDGSIVNYTWELGDGTLEYGVIVSHMSYLPGNYIINLTVTDNDGTSSADTCNVTITPKVLSSTIDIDPDTLNLKSKGRWITCYIDLPGCDVNDIDITTILLEDTIPAEWGDIQNETLMVKFDRSEVEDMLSPGTYNLKVSGELVDGTGFEGESDEVRVIGPG